MPAHLAQIVVWSATWLLCIAAFLLILFRPRNIPEYVWAVGGAGLLLAFRLLSPSDAWIAVRAGTSVYLFLAGMMLMAELARQHGVFDWLAEVALEHSHGSQLRLFVLVYCIGAAVTALLSNDATAVLLTPAVLAVVRRTKTSPLPYLFACAFVANAASFVLPISNPANLVVFAGDLPTLGQWIRIFLLSAIAAIAVTFLLLWWRSRGDLRARLQNGIRPAALDAMSRRAGIGVLIGAGALLTTSALGGNVGLAALIAGIMVMVYVARTDWHVMTAAIRNISWGVIPLVAGLFVMVQALKGVGVLSLASGALEHVATWPPVAGLSATAFVVGVLANAINNLPMGLIGATAVHAAHSSMMMHAAVLLGINLGPNLSITGSLATILWLDALRRENVQVTGGQFLRTGAILMPCAMIVALLPLLATAH
jgi:arsenical pump membrane protein